MKICSFALIPIVLTLFMLLQSCKSQAGLDFPDTPPTRSAPKPLRICNPEDKLSNSYCVCENHVVSCDFSKYIIDTTTADNSSANTNDTNIIVNPSDHVELTLYGYRFPPNTSRFCICNAPPNLHLTFALNDFLHMRNNIQRYDLFNLSGITHFQDGFKLNFNGDLYIANVSKIPEISSFEFGRGYDEPISNVQDLKCCSPIKVNQNHEKPLLLIENSTIGLVQSRGLDDNHLWKTVILKSNKFNAVEENGVTFTSTDGINVAILGNRFKNVSVGGLRFKGAANLFIVKNQFRGSDGVNDYFFGSRSALKDSNIVLLDNEFWNKIYMDMDARHIVSWYNIFYLWDNHTFVLMNKTSFSASNPNIDGSGANDRSLSFKHNIVNRAELPENSLDFGADSMLTLSDNVLGTCNCSGFMIKDKMVKPELNWCYTKSVNTANGKCSIRLDAAFEQCNKSQAVNFDELCGDKKISGPRFPGEGTNLTVDVDNTKINSSFISRIVKDFHSLFGINRVIKLRGLLNNRKTASEHTGADQDNDQHDDEHPVTASDKDNGKKKDSHKQVSQKSNVAVAIMATMTVLVFIIVLGIILYKNKHRFSLRRSGHHELIDDNRSNEMI